jgi:hypothetical protein
MRNEKKQLYKGSLNTIMKLQMEKMLIMKSPKKVKAITGGLNITEGALYPTLQTEAERNSECRL